MVEPRGTRIAVVGTGNVGSTFAYALLITGLAAEIVLIDVNRADAEGEAMDLNHAMPFAHPTRIWAGDYADCAGAAIVVVAAGVGQKSGETRLDLLKRNATIFASVIPSIARHNPDGILLIATNPVDVLTYAAWKYSGMPSYRVIGSGTTLDTARFRYLLSQHFGIDARSVHAYIIGEHGDSEVPVWSLANIGGMHLSTYCQTTGVKMDDDDMQAIFRATRDAAYEIIQRKGSTHYAIAAGLIRIVQAILRDQHTVLSVSSQVDDYLGIRDVYLSLPSIVHRNGIQQILRLNLSSSEAEALRSSAKLLRTTIAQLDLPRREAA